MRRVPGRACKFTDSCCQQRGDVQTGMPQRNFRFLHDWLHYETQCFMVSVTVNHLCTPPVCYLNVPWRTVFPCFNIRTTPFCLAQQGFLLDKLLSISFAPVNQRTVLHSANDGTHVNSILNFCIQLQEYGSCSLQRENQVEPVITLGKQNFETLNLQRV